MIAGYLICMLGTYELGYNTTVGGDVNPMTGKTHTKYSKEKISKALIGHDCSETTKEKIRKDHKTKQYK